MKKKPCTVWRELAGQRVQHNERALSPATQEQWETCAWSGKGQHKKGGKPKQTDLQGWKKGICKGLP
jgi:hypothetical protein